MHKSPGRGGQGRQGRPDAMELAGASGCRFAPHRTALLPPRGTLPEPPGRHAAHTHTEREREREREREGEIGREREKV